MNSTSAELGAGGHTASYAQYKRSVQQWVADGLSFDEILTRLAEDLASGRIEHGERQPCNTVVYEEKEGRLYSPTFKCFISDLFEPDPKIKIDGYPEMLARNKENLLEAEKRILQSGAKEVWVPSPAADYNSDHGVVYRYRKEGNQILMDAIDGPKDVKDLLDFVGQLSGKNPEGIYDKNGALVGMRTVSNDFVSEISSSQITDLLSTRYGNRESALITRYNDLPHEITDSLKYFQQKVGAAIEELKQTLDPAAFQRGDYSSLSRVVESITSELKGYEQGNTVKYFEDKYSDFNYQQIQKSYNEFSSRNFDTTTGGDVADNKSLNIAKEDDFTHKIASFESTSTDNQKIQFDNYIPTQNSQGTISAVSFDSSIQRPSAATSSEERNISTQNVVANNTSSEKTITTKEITRLLDPIYRIAHQLSKPQSILNRIRAEGWQSWLSLPKSPVSSASSVSNEPKSKAQISITNIASKAIDPNIQIKNRIAQDLKPRIISDRLLSREATTQLQLRRKEVLMAKLSTQERQKVTQQIERTNKNPLRIELLSKITLQKPISIREFISLKRAVLENLARLTNNNPNRINTLSVAKLVLTNTNVMQKFLSLQPAQLKNLLQLSRFALQTLLLTQQNQTVRIPLQSFKLINVVLLAKYKTIIDNLAAKYKLDKSLLTPKEIKFIESRKLILEALKLIRKLQTDTKLLQQNQNKLIKNLVVIDPRLRALLMQLLKLGVLDELLASDEDWLQSVEEVRTQRTKREMRFVTKEAKDKILKLKNSRRTKQSHARIHKDSTSIRRKSTNKLQVKSISQVAANVAPNYELLPSTSLAKVGNKDSKDSN